MLATAWRGVLLAAVLLPLAQCFLRAPALPGAQARIDYQAQPRHRAAGASRHLCMRFLDDVRYPAPDEHRALPGDEHALSRKDFLLALAAGSASLLAPGSAVAAAKAAPMANKSAAHSSTHRRPSASTSRPASNAPNKAPNGTAEVITPSMNGSMPN
jgi:hypothetical protein